MSDEARNDSAPESEAPAPAEGTAQDALDAAAAAPTPASGVSSLPSAHGLPSIVPRSPEDGLQSALDALLPSLLPARPLLTADASVPPAPAAPSDGAGIDTPAPTEALPRVGLASAVLSHPRSTFDPGAQAALRALPRRTPSEPYLPLSSFGPESERARAELLEHLAGHSDGRHRAELRAAAAEQWQRLAEPERAEDLLMGAHRDDAHDLNVVRELRKYAVAAGDHARTARLCTHEAQLALTPEERASVLLLRAEVELTRADRTAALASLHESLACRPSASAWLTLSALQAGAGQALEAAASLQRAAELIADAELRGALWLQAGRLLERGAEPASAQSAFARAHHEDPSLIDAVFLEQRLARARGDVRGALHALGRAAQGLRDEPIAEDLMRARAHLLEAAGGASNDALALLGSARREVGLRLRARLAERAGAFAERRAALETSAARGAGAERVLSLVGLSELHAGAGDLDAARQALREAGLIDRDSTLVRTMQANLLRTSDAPSAVRYTDEDAAADQILEAAVRAAKDPEAGTHELALLARVADENHSADLIALDLEVELGHWDEVDARLAREVKQAPSAAQRVGVELARRELREEHPSAASSSAEEAWAESSLLALIFRIHRAQQPAEKGALWLALAAELRGDTAAAFATLAGDLLAASGAGREAYERALTAAPGYAPACWSLERMLSTVEDRPALRRVHSALARATSDPLERAARELRVSLLGEGGDPLTPARKSAVSTPPESVLVAASDVLCCDRWLSAGDDAQFLALAEQLESSGRSSQGPLAAVAKLRAAALYEDAGEAVRAAVLYREVLDVSQGRDAHAALGLSRALDDAGLPGLLFEHLERTALRLSRVTARRDALEELACLQSERGVSRHAAASFRTLLEFDPDHIGALRARQRDAMERADWAELAERSERLAERVRDRNERAAQLRLAARARGMLAQPVQLVAADAQLGLWHALEVGNGARARNNAPVFCASWLELCVHMKDAGEQAFCALRAAEALEQVSAARAVLALAPYAQAAPRHPQVYETLARLRQAALDAAGAAQDCEQAAAVAASPARRARLWYRAAVTWEDAAGDDARARRALRVVVGIDVLYFDSFDRLRRLLIAASEWAALAELLERRVAAGGERELCVTLLIERAQLLSRVDQSERAKTALSAALALDPTCLPALRTLAELHVADKQWREAADTLIGVARLTSDHDVLRTAFMTLGRIYTEHLPDLRRAEIAYARAAGLDPNDIEAIERLLFVFRRKGDHDRALRACERLVDLARDDAEIDARTIEAAAVLEDMGQRLRAERALNDRREQQPASAAIIAALSDLYARQHDAVALRVHLDRSIHGLRRGVLEQPADATRIRELGEALEQRGRAHAAQAVSALAVDLGLGDGRTEERARRFAPLGAVALSPEIVAQLWPHALSEPMREVARFLQTKTAALLAPKDLGQALARQPLALRRALAIVEACLAPREIALVTRNDRSVVALRGRPLTIAFGQDLTTGCDIDELAFLVVRALAILQLGMNAVVSADRNELAALLRAAVQPESAEGATPPGPDPKLSARQRTELQTLLRAVARDGLLDAEALQNAVLEMGSRVAFVALGKCAAGLAALRATRAPLRPSGYEDHDLLGAIEPGSDAHALLSFALSDAYLELQTQRESQAEAGAR